MRGNLSWPSDRLQVHLRIRGKYYMIALSAAINFSKVKVTTQDSSVMTPHWPVKTTTSCLLLDLFCFPAYSRNKKFLALMECISSFVVLRDFVFDFTTRYIESLQDDGTEGEKFNFWNLRWKTDCH